jgi:hypothetical protein
MDSNGFFKNDLFDSIKRIGKIKTRFYCNFLKLSLGSITNTIRKRYGHSPCVKYFYFQYVEFDGNDFIIKFASRIVSYNALRLILKLPKTVQ